MTPARKGDGTGLSFNGYSQIRKGDGTVLWDAIPDSGGTHQWNYSEGSGPTVVDAIDSLDIDFSAGITWQSGSGAGDAYASLDGSSDYGDMGATSQSAFTHFTQDGKGTLFYWINPNDLSRSVLSSTGRSSAEICVAVLVQDGGDIRFAAHDGSGDGIIWDAVASDAVATTDGWVPTTVTADGSTARVYVGDPLTEVASASIGGLVSGDHSNNMLVGRSPTTDSDYYEGGLDLSWADDVGRSQSDLQEFVDESSQFYE